MKDRRLLYIESDGQVYLVQRDGVWTFPDEGTPLDFRFSVRHSTKILDAVVVFCRPDLREFPAHWMFKDDVPLRRDIDPIVQRAINASLARCVAGALVVGPQGKVLMVKSNRGFTKGMWNIPGGFIEYGERPEDAIAREVREETGLVIEPGALIGVYTERFESPYFMYGFMFEATASNDAVRANPSEIEDVRWMSPEEAMAATRNPFAIQAMRRRFNLKALRPPGRRPPAASA